jgi:hypothetical protein
MRQVNISPPDISWAQMNKRKNRMDAKNVLLDPKGRLNKKNMEELLDIWMHVQYEIDTDSCGDPYIVNLAETLKNSQYYTTYLSKYMEIMRSDSTYSSKSTVAQWKDPEWSSFAPLPLKAAKLSQGINYQVWNHPETRRKVLINFMWHTVSDWLLEQEEKRSTMVVSPAGTWTYMCDYYQNEYNYNAIFAGKSSYKLKVMPKAIDDETGEDTTSDWRDLPRVYQHMMMQTWIFDPRIRHPDMILHPFNWSYVPPAHTWIAKEESEQEYAEEDIL